MSITPERKEEIKRNIDRLIDSMFYYGAAEEGKEFRELTNELMSALEDANKEIVGLAKLGDSDTKAIVKLASELNEAQQTIKDLRKERDNLKKTAIALSIRNTPLEE